MTPHEAKQRVATDEDFVFLKRFDFSLKKLLERYPEGCPDRIIAQALCVAEYEVEERYQLAIVKLRGIMGVTD